MKQSDNMETGSYIECGFRLNITKKVKTTIGVTDLRGKKSKYSYLEFYNR